MDIEPAGEAVAPLHAQSTLSLLSRPMQRETALRAVDILPLQQGCPEARKPCGYLVQRSRGETEG